MIIGVFLCFLHLRTSHREGLGIRSDEEERSANGTQQVSTGACGKQKKSVIEKETQILDEFIPSEVFDKKEKSYAGNFECVMCFLQGKRFRGKVLQGTLKICGVFFAGNKIQDNHHLLVSRRRHLPGTRDDHHCGRCLSFRRTASILVCVNFKVFVWKVCR